jgi:osmoprotectant transport system substrate-binding protein
MGIRLRVAVAVIGLSLCLAACGSDGSPTTTSGPTQRSAGSIPYRSQNRAVVVTVGSRAPVRQQILGEVYAQGLEAAGYTVRRRFNLGFSAWKSVEAHAVDGYPETIATVLTAALGHSPAEVPVDPEKVYGLLHEELAPRGMFNFHPAPFSQLLAVAVPRALARRYDLRTISDLRRVSPRLALAVSPGCRNDPGCLAHLEETYGLTFAPVRPAPPPQSYAQLDNGEAGAAIVETTDPELMESEFVLLADNRHAFRGGSPFWLTSQRAVRSDGPDYWVTVEAVQGKLTLAAVRQMNAEVELEGKTPAVVAENYLRAAGYVG